MNLTGKKVRDIMVPLTEYPVVTWNEPLEKAVLRLSEEYLEPSTGIRHRTILVVDDKRNLVGILDFRTILQTLIPDRISEIREQVTGILKQAVYTEESFQDLGDATHDFTERLIAQAKVPVKKLMLKIRGTVQADENLLNATRIKCRKKVTVLPVYEGDKLVGVLRDVDLFLTAADLLRTGPVRRALPQMPEKHAAKYKSFRELLDHNRRALTLMADLEQTYYANRPFTVQQIKRHYDILHSEVDAIIHCLESLSGKKSPTLSMALVNIQRTIEDQLAARILPVTDALVMPLEEVKPGHLSAVGGKAANLAVIKRELRLPVPEGFVVTSADYEHYLTETALAVEIDSILAEIDPNDLETIEFASLHIQDRIKETPLPPSIEQELTSAYAALEQRTVPDIHIAVRSSAVGEDTETSFAGQYTSLLNVKKDNLLEAYKTVLASKYSVSALSYRLYHGLDDRETPMCVLILAMVDAQESGVLYTADPVTADLQRMKINTVVGLGEALVGGVTSAHSTYLLNKEHFQVLEHTGETDIVGSKGDGVLRKLWENGVQLENYFGGPLDIEWTVDRFEQLFLLQSRQLRIFREGQPTEYQPVQDYHEYEILLEGGKCVSNGAAAGRVLVLKDEGTFGFANRLDGDVILVIRTSSPAYAKFMGKVRGIISDVGSVTSHLASVAREFGVPALFDTQHATSTFRDGQEITLWATRTKVLSGVVEDLIRSEHNVKRPIFASPSHLKMQSILESVSPLNLTDPQDPSFSENGCKTLQDIIRFTHEQAMRAMFGYGKVAEQSTGAVRLKTATPLWLYVIDLGGGLREDLTRSNVIDTASVTSVPFKAVLSGLSHPGIKWSGGIGLSARSLMTLIASAATQPNEDLGGPSYAIVSQDYMNFNARFGYHFATLDALCGNDSNQNYVTLQFAGGVGSYYGRSLRIQFLANVLQRLGFFVQVKGDLIEAGLSRLDRTAMETALDQLGRLLGSSRLLDLGIDNLERVAAMTESFFQQDYDFLEGNRKDKPRDLYISVGNWRRIEKEGRTVCIQDGSDYGSWISSKVAGVMGRFFGSGYGDFLDNIQAYYYFPLAIAKDSAMELGTMTVRVKPVAGSVDQAGGIAFGIRNMGNYFVFRINALENNAALFEFKNSKRLKLAKVDTPMPSNVWSVLRVEIAGHQVKAYLNNSLLIDYEADRSVGGYLGLWTKADSVTEFDSFEFGTPEAMKTVGF